METNFIVYQIRKLTFNTKIVNLSLTLQILNIAEMRKSHLRFITFFWGDTPESQRSAVTDDWVASDDAHPNLRPPAVPKLENLEQSLEEYKVISTVT